MRDHSNNQPVHPGWEFTMRRIILAAVMLVAALAPLLAVPARPALAAPAQPVNDSGCRTDEEYEICWTEKGVVQRQVLPSGDEKHTYNATLRETLTLNGKLISEHEAKLHAVFLFEADGDLHLTHQLASGTNTYADGTCTWMYNFTYDDGQLRHWLYSFECTT
jgi:hypothetical protein